MKNLTNIMKSASKIVFITLAIGATVGFFTGNLGEDNFMILAGMAFAFYFSHKGDRNEDYLGK